MQKETAKNGQMKKALDTITARLKRKVRHTHSPLVHTTCNTLETESDSNTSPSSVQAQRECVGSDRNDMKVPIVSENSGLYTTFSNAIVHAPCVVRM